MAMFGSTSPSYLTLASLDLCNCYLADGYRERLREMCGHLNEARKTLAAAGWQIEPSDPLRLTVKAPSGMWALSTASSVPYFRHTSARAEMSAMPPR